MVVVQSVDGYWQSLCLALNLESVPAVYLLGFQVSEEVSCGFSDSVSV